MLWTLSPEFTLWEAKYQVFWVTKSWRFIETYRSSQHQYKKYTMRGSVFLDDFLNSTNKTKQVFFTDILTRKKDGNYFSFLSNQLYICEKFILKNFNVRDLCDMFPININQDEVCRGNHVAMTTLLPISFWFHEPSEEPSSSSFSPPLPLQPRISSDKFHIENRESFHLPSSTLSSNLSLFPIQFTGVARVRIRGDRVLIKYDDKEHSFLQ